MESADTVLLCYGLPVAHSEEKMLTRCHFRRGFLFRINIY